MGGRLPLCRSSSLACLEGRGSNSSAKGEQGRFRDSLWGRQEEACEEPGRSQRLTGPEVKKSLRGWAQSSGTEVKQQILDLACTCSHPSPAPPELLRVLVYNRAFPKVVRLKEIMHATFRTLCDPQ